MKYLALIALALYLTSYAIKHIDISLASTQNAVNTHLVNLEVQQ